MSYNVFSFISRCKVGSTAAKCLLLIMADHADDQGLCWPSIDYLADRTEMSARSVQRHLRELEQAGWVRVDTRTGRSSRYWLKSPADDQAEAPTIGQTASAESAQAPPPTPQSAPPPPPTSRTDRGDTRVTPGVTTMSPGSTSEPSRTTKGGTKITPPPSGCPELQLLREAGAQFIQQDQAAWNGLIQAHGLKTVVAQISMLVAGGSVARSRSVAEALQPSTTRQQEKPVGTLLRGWLMKNNEVSRAYLSNEQLVNIAKNWGVSALTEIAGEAVKTDGVITYELAKEYLFGRPSAYGGWDYYEPKNKLECPLSDEKLKELVAA